MDKWHSITIIGVAFAVALIMWALVWDNKQANAFKLEAYKVTIEKYGTNAPPTVRIR